MNRRELERALLEALVDAGPSYVVDLAAAVDEHPVAVEHACDRLRAADDVRPIGCRRYELTPAGRRRLDDTEPATGGPNVPRGTEGRP